MTGPWLDASVPIRAGMPTYPGEDGPTYELIKAMERGDVADVGRLRLALHTGTHVDAPRHFLLGASGVDQLPLDVLVGPARVVDVDARPHIGAADLGDALGGASPGDRLLLRTRNSRAAPACWEREAFDPEFAAVTPDGARWLVDHRVRLVGVDYLSVEPFGSVEPMTHRILLGAGVVVVEGLDLRHVPAGACELVCLPLRIVDADGSPARVMIRPVG